MTLASDNQLASLFARRKGLRLFLLRARPGGAERAVAERGGGVPLAFRARGRADRGTRRRRPAPAAAPGAARAADRGPASVRSGGWSGRTSAAPAHLGAHERRRSRRSGPAPGGPSSSCTIERDFSAGLGKVAYLFGSGIVLDPDFSQLVVLDGGRRHAPAAVYADGPTLELALRGPGRARRTCAWRTATSTCP